MSFSSISSSYSSGNYSLFDDTFPFEKPSILERNDEVFPEDQIDWTLAPSSSLVDLSSVNDVANRILSQASQTTYVAGSQINPSEFTKAHLETSNDNNSVSMTNVQKCSKKKKREQFIKDMVAEGYSRAVVELELSKKSNRAFRRMYRFKEKIQNEGGIVTPEAVKEYNKKFKKSDKKIMLKNLNNAKGKVHIVEEAKLELKKRMQEFLAIARITKKRWRLKVNLLPKKIYSNM